MGLYLLNLYYYSFFFAEKREKEKSEKAERQRQHELEKAEKAKKAAYALEQQEKAELQQRYIIGCKKICQITSITD